MLELILLLAFLMLFPAVIGLAVRLSHWIDRRMK